MSEHWPGGGPRRHVWSCALGLLAALLTAAPGAAEAASAVGPAASRPQASLPADPTPHGVLAFGAAGFAGDLAGVPLNRPVVGMAATSTGNGYWLVASDGGIFPFGDAVQHSHGSTGGMRLNRPIVGMAATSSGDGYWLVASDGGIFPFGDAAQRSYGSTGGRRLNRPVVGMAATAGGHGYWLVASDGGIFPFGDAVDHSYGSTGGIRLNQPVVGMARTASGNGYWLIAQDGGVFPFGDARGLGSLGGQPLNAPIVAAAATADGTGYWMAAADGGVFPFGTAGGYGSGAVLPRVGPVVAMVATPRSDGYWLAATPGAPPSGTFSVPPANGNGVMLTFDDCAPPAAINAILNALDSHHWLATFFPTGLCRDLNPWLVPTLLARGHLVCNHTYSHPFLTRLGDAAVAAEIEGGVHAGCDLFRPPYGDWDGPGGRVARIAALHGYRVLMWDVDTRDWGGTSAAVMVAMIHARRGVVLMHLQGPHTAEAVRNL